MREPFPVLLIPEALESALRYQVHPKPFDKPAPVAPPQPDLSKFVTKQGKLAQTFGLGGLADRLNQTAVREAQAVYEREKVRYQGKLEQWQTERASHERQQAELTTEAQQQKARYFRVLECLRTTARADNQRDMSRVGNSEAYFSVFLYRFFADSIHRRLSLNHPSAAVARAYAPDFVYWG